MRLLFILAAIIALGAGAWALFREDGVIEQVTQERVEAVLLANRVPPRMAQCMAPRLVDRLSIGQLQNLEKLAPEEGESLVPLSTGEAMARFRRVDDREAVEQLVLVAGGCGFDLMRERF